MLLVISCQLESYLRLDRHKRILQKLSFNKICAEKRIYFVLFKKSICERKCGEFVITLYSVNG